MGTMHHHAIVVTSCHGDWLGSNRDHHDPDAHIKRIHAKAVEFGLAPTEITPPVVNYYRSFLIPPDGSKEGWAESNAADTRRAAFIAWLKKAASDKTPHEERCYCDWVEVEFGELGYRIARKG